MKTHTGREQSRRMFLGTLGAAAAAQGCRGIGIEATTASPGLGAAKRSKNRAARAFSIRTDAASHQNSQPLPADLTNGDEERYSSRFASFSKGLPHDDGGEVDPAAYTALLNALASGRSADFAIIPLGGNLKLANPQAAYTYTLQGADSHHLELPPPPAFASAEAAADMVELYWQYVLRDIPFDAFQSQELPSIAAADLSGLPAYQGIRRSGIVSPAALFRGHTPGDAVGPYASQFPSAPVPHGVYTIDQRFRTPLPVVDYVTTPSELLAQQRGSEPTADPALEREARYIRTGRDLTRYVHRDYPFQTFLNAALILARLGEQFLAPTPYNLRACSFGSSQLLVRDDGFSTFGTPQVLDAVTAVANLALHASWRQKWLLHRRLRPEVFAQRVDRVIHHGGKYPVHQDLLRSAVHDHLSPGSALLPMAYPEGAPCHPSYPAAHAAIGGACVTVLKAFFREDAVFPAPVVAAADGLSLLPYEGAPLTVGGELNKLASNVSMARDFAGIHYRSDCIAGMNLGERVALSYLDDMRRCITDDFEGFALTTFAGRAVTV